MARRLLTSQGASGKGAIMTYKELKDRQQEEINAFPFIWAFNEKQLADGMRKLGLNPDTDKDKLCSIGGGGIIRKTDAEAMRAMFERHRRELQEAIAADKTGEGFIYDMFSTELANHEYSYTGDVTDAVNACGLTVEQLNANPALIKGLKKAADDQRDE